MKTRLLSAGLTTARLGRLILSVGYIGKATVGYGGLRCAPTRVGHKQRLRLCHLKNRSKNTEVVNGPTTRILHSIAVNDRRQWFQSVGGSLCKLLKVGPYVR